MRTLIVLVAAMLSVPSAVASEEFSGRWEGGGTLFVAGDGTVFCVRVQTDVDATATRVFVNTRRMLCSNFTLGWVPLDF